ncbi:AbaSI family restriction endonuclease [Microbacterium hydrothermale]|uniref:AbaSI family restriction endonuclease n=1 Tax=Microbacterium hydrothermale TaxID=857427 RepID=UPI0010A7D5A1|nr:hypothetical protein [Microbacterium hydrothermale]
MTTAQIATAGMHRSTFEYLVRTLSTRTAGKKYESYVLNQLWFALDDPQLQPVAQQFVDRRALNPAVGLANFAAAAPSDDQRHRAFIDLYFPQLHVGVECDEGHHSELEERQRDAGRTADIERLIPDYEEIRIDVETDDDGLPVDPAAVDAKLAEAVRRIRERKARVIAGDFDWGRFEPWQTALADWQIALAAGRLRADDVFLYAHNGQIRELFGRGDGSGTRIDRFRGGFRLGDTGYAVWMPTLSEANGDGVYRSTNSKGLLNVLFPEGDEVVIGQADPAPDAVDAQLAAKEANRVRRQNGETPLPVPPLTYPLTPEDYRQASPTSYWSDVRRLTFARTRDAIGRTGYRFIGVFQNDGGFRRDARGTWFQTCRLVASEIDLTTLAASPGTNGRD